MASWTATITANIGDTYTASWYNQQTRDNLTYLKDALDTEVAARAAAITALPVVVAGIVDDTGTITAGTGFTVAHPATGRYVITKTGAAWASNVKAVVGQYSGAGMFNMEQETTGTTGFEIRVYNESAALTDHDFSFVAVG